MHARTHSDRERERALRTFYIHKCMFSETDLKYNSGTQKLSKRGRKDDISYQYAYNLGDVIRMVFSENVNLLLQE